MTSGAVSTRMTLGEAVAAYLEEIARVRTENVVGNHVSLSRRFLAYFSSQRKVTELSRLRQPDLEAFLDWLTHRRGSYKASTFNMGVEFLRRFAHFCLARGWLEEDPSAAIPFVDIKVEVPVVLERQEMDRLIEVSRGDDFYRVLVGLLGEVGLKKQELVALCFADLELDEPGPAVVVRYSGKLRRKSRRLPLPAELAAALRRYVLSRQVQGTYGLLHPLVPITGRQVNNIIVALCKKAGVRRANPQMLRDTAAVRMLAAGRPPEEVGRQLGYTPRGYLLEFLPRFRPWIKT